MQLRTRRIPKCPTCGKKMTPDSYRKYCKCFDCNEIIMIGKVRNTAVQIRRFHLSHLLKKRSPKTPVAGSQYNDPSAENTSHCDRCKRWNVCIEESYRIWEEVSRDTAASQHFDGTETTVNYRFVTTHPVAVCLNCVSEIQQEEVRGNRLPILFFALLAALFIVGGVVERYSPSGSLGATLGFSAAGAICLLLAYASFRPTPDTFVADGFSTAFLKRTIRFPHLAVTGEQEAQMRKRGVLR